MMFGFLAVLKGWIIILVSVIKSHPTLFLLELNDHNLLLFKNTSRCDETGSPTLFLLAYKSKRQTSEFRVNDVKETNAGLSQCPFFNWLTNKRVKKIQNKRKCRNRSVDNGTSD